MFTFLKDINPSIIIEGGAVVVALFALFGWWKQSAAISTILKNHLKHIEANQDEDVKSRVNLGQALQELTDTIREFHLASKKR